MLRLNAMLPPFDPWHTAMTAFDVASSSKAGPADLARMRAQRLVVLLEAARRAPMFEALIGARDPATIHLQDLPITNKAMLMANFAGWVTDPELKLDEMCRFVADPTRIGEAYLGRYLLWESSGSTGGSGLFVQDARSLAVYDALEAIRRPVPRPFEPWLQPWRWLDERTAFVVATNGHFASTLSVERLRQLNPLLARTLCCVPFLQPLAQLSAQLMGIAPQILATYPSVAVMLAEEQLDGRLELHLREVWTGGETLTDAMRATIAHAFHCDVVNNYGASEFMSLASECAHHQLHLNSDWAILEPVDDKGLPVPPGVMSATTLLTNLANHVQPIIRYDLGDRVTVHADPCTCGSHLPVIEVHGRSGDLIRLPGAQAGEDTRVSGLALSTVLETVEALSDFQLIQHAPDRLELRTELSGPGTGKMLRQARSVLETYLRSQGAADVHIACHSNCPSLRSRNGKVQRVMAMT